DLVQLADKLERLATTDSLTGLFNRRHFISTAEVEWDRCARYLHPMSVLMVDIDQFKLINDNFGHGAGDRVIKGIADICRLQRRGSDVAARFGGDEFIIMLPETALDDAILSAERLREAAAGYDFVGESARVKATVSIGAAEAGPEMVSVFD